MAVQSATSSFLAVTQPSAGVKRSDFSMRSVEYIRSKGTSS